MITDAGSEVAGGLVGDGLGQDLAVLPAEVTTAGASRPYERLQRVTTGIGPLAGEAGTERLSGQVVNTDPAPGRLGRQAVDQLVGKMHH
jgi:hypothetical protein